MTVDASGTITLTYNASNEERRRLYEQLKSMLGNSTWTTITSCPITRT